MVNIANNSLYRCYYMCLCRLTVRKVKLKRCLSVQTFGIAILIVNLSRTTDS